MREHNCGPASSRKKNRGASSGRCGRSTRIPLVWSAHFLNRPHDAGLSPVLACNCDSSKMTPKRGGPQQLLEAAVHALDSGDTSLLLERRATKKKGKKKGGGGGGGATAEGELPIHHAVRTNATDALQKMLMQEHGLQEELLLAQGAKGWLPLHYAVQTRQVETVRMLCGRSNGGADIDLSGDLVMRQVVTADTTGRLPIHYAMEASDCATMLELAASGSEDQLTTPDPSSGATAIHHVAKIGAPDLVDAMISPLADSARRTVLLYNCDADGRLPVHCAVLGGDRKSTHALGYVHPGPGIASSAAQAARTTSPADAPDQSVEGGDATGEATGDEVDHGGMTTIPMLTPDRHGKTPVDYAFDIIEEAKENAELTITQSDSEWNTELQAVVASHAEAQQAWEQDCAHKDAELAEKDQIIEALQAEVARLKQSMEAVTAAAAAAASDAAASAVEASAEEGVPPGS